jgi:hypothetical protein
MNMARAGLYLHEFNGDAEERNLRPVDYQILDRINNIIDHLKNKENQEANKLQHDLMWVDVVRLMARDIIEFRNDDHETNIGDNEINLLIGEYVDLDLKGDNWYQASSVHKRVQEIRIRK